MWRLALLLLALCFAFGCDSDEDDPVKDSSIIGDVGDLADIGPVTDDGVGGEGGDGGEDGGVVADTGTVGGGGGDELFCDPISRFGVTRAPVVAAEGGVAQYNPRAVHTGDGWGLLWLSPNGSNNDVLFQRLDADGAPQGAAIKLDTARSPQLELIYDASGQRFMAVWRSERPSQVGVTFQMLSAAGEPQGDLVLVPETFSATHFAAGWADGLGGMIGYASPEGFSVAPISNGGELMPAQRLFEGVAEGAAVVNGVDGWGCAWRGFDSEAGKFDLIFALTDDNGAPYLDLKHVRWDDGGAQGYVQIAHGSNTYAVGWSRKMGFGVQTAVTLFQGNDVLATPPIPGAETYGLITDLTWLPADQFGVAWMDQDDEGFFVGLTTLKTSGQVSTPIVIRERGHEVRNMAVGGTMTRAYGFFMDEPNPSPTGFSDDVRVKRIEFGDCEI